MAERGRRIGPVVRATCGCLVLGSVLEAGAAAGLKVEAVEARRQAWLEQGVNHTYAFSWSRRSRASAIRRRFWVAEPAQPFRFVFWFQADRLYARTGLSAQFRL